MKFLEIYQKLNFEKELLYSPNPDQVITTVLPFTVNMPTDKNVLYVTDIKSLPETIDASGLSFLCTGNKKNLPNYYIKHNFILTQSVSKAELFAGLSQILSQELNYTTAMNHLIYTVINNKGLQAIIDEAFKTIKSPIVIIDNSYKILAMNKEINQVSEKFKLQHELGYLLEENLEDIKNAKIYEVMRKTKLPYYSTDPKTGLTWINSLVYVYGLEAAHLGVIETERKFTAQDQEFISFLCNLISLELQKNDSYIRNYGIMHNLFLSELLDGVISSPSLIDIRSRQLEWQSSGNFCIMTLFDKGNLFFNKKAATIGEYFRPFFQNIKWAVYDNKIVFLLTLKENNLSAVLENNQTILNYLKDNSMVAAFSNVFRELKGTANAYRQSLKAFELGEKLDNDMLYHFYINYICNDIGAILSQSTDISSFYNEKVIAIANYDQEKKSSFIKTLDEYLTHIDDPNTAAKHLYIHRNTLFYRINKMQNLFGINLNDGLERLHIHLSIKFLENL